MSINASIAKKILIENNGLEKIFFFATIPFFLSGFIGNVLVIRIVHKKRTMHTKTNYLLVTLALSDIITIFMAPLCFFSHQSGYLSEGFGTISCKIIPSTEISIAVSSFTLTVLAAERYHALVKPFRTGWQLNDENIKKVVAFIWIISTLFCLPFFVFQEWSQSLSRCVGPWSLHMNQTVKVYVFIVAVFVTYIPITAMVYFYGSLINGLYFSKTICSETTSGERDAEKSKLVVTFLLVSAGFCIGYGPFAIFYTLLAAGYDKQTDFFLYSVLSSLFICIFNASLCLNPILYAFRSSNFKESFKSIFFCRRSTSSNEIELYDV